MNLTNELKTNIYESLGTFEILDFNKDFILLKFEKNGRVEFVTCKYNDKDIYNACYFVGESQSETQHIATENFYQRIREYQ